MLGRCHRAVRLSLRAACCAPPGSIGDLSGAGRSQPHKSSRGEGCTKANVTDAVSRHPPLGNRPRRG